MISVIPNNWCSFICFSDRCPFLTGWHVLLYYCIKDLIFFLMFEYVSKCKIMYFSDCCFSQLHCEAEAILLETAHLLQTVRFTLSWPGFLVKGPHVQLSATWLKSSCRQHTAWQKVLIWCSSWERVNPAVNSWVLAEELPIPFTCIVCMVER